LKPIYHYSFEEGDVKNMKVKTNVKAGGQISNI